MQEKSVNFYKVFVLPKNNKIFQKCHPEPVSGYLYGTVLQRIWGLILCFILIMEEILNQVQNDHWVCLPRGSSFWKLRKFLRIKWALNFLVIQNLLQVQTDSGSKAGMTFWWAYKFLHSLSGLPRQSYDCLAMTKNLSSTRQYRHCER